MEKKLDNLTDKLLGALQTGTQTPEDGQEKSDLGFFLESQKFQSVLSKRCCYTNIRILGAKLTTFNLHFNTLKANALLVAVQLRRVQFWQEEKPSIRTASLAPTVR